MSMPERDTMHLRNKKAVGVLFFTLAATAFLGGQAQPSQPQAQTPQRVEPTHLPPDVDPYDPALPVWARPATPPPSAAASPAPAANVPGKQPGGNPGEAPISEGAVGAVTTDAKGGFTYVSRVNEVTLSATV